MSEIEQRRGMLQAAQPPVFVGIDTGSVKRATVKPNHWALQSAVRLVLALVLAPFLLSLAPAEALAHAEYLRSDPPADGVLEAAPRLLTITFTEPIETYLLDISVFSEAGQRVDSADAHRLGTGRQASVGLGDLGVGAYVVRWRAMGVDGHILTNAFNFGVGKPASMTMPTTPGRSPGPDAVVRWLTLLAACVLIGGVLFRQLVLAPAIRARSLGSETLKRADGRLLSIVWVGFSFFIGASILQLVEQLLAAGGEANISMLGQVLGSLSGQLWIARIALLGALGAVLAQCESRTELGWDRVRRAESGRTSTWAPLTPVGSDVRAIALARLQVRPDFDAPHTGPLRALQTTRGRGSPEPGSVHVAAARALTTMGAPRDQWWWMAAAVGLAILMLFSLGGHAAVTEPVWLTVPVDWVHLVAAVVWVGGTFYLAVFWAARQASPELFVALLKRFSVVAGVSVAILIPTGLFAAWTFVPSPAETVNSLYGLVLLAKVALVAGMGLLGLLHWRTAHQADGPKPHLDRSLFGEVVLGAAVLATVGLLVNLPPAQEQRTSQAEAAEMAQTENLRDVPTEALSFAGRAGPNLVTVTVDPPRPGNQRLTMDVIDDLGRPVDDASVSVQARSSDPSVPLSSVIARREGSGRYVTKWSQGTGRADLLVAVARPGMPEVSASFILDIPVSGAKDILRRADLSMNQLISLTEHKVVEGTAGGTHAVTYTYVSPDRMRATDSSGFEMIAALGQRFERNGTEWRSEPWPDLHGFRWPSYSYAASANVRLLGIQDLAGEPHFVVTFADDQAARNTVWIDVASYLVRRHEILAAGHYITTNFSDFNGGLAVNPPNLSMGMTPVLANPPETDQASNPMDMPIPGPNDDAGDGRPPARQASEGPGQTLFGSARVLNFQDVATGDAALNGLDATGIVDWGTGVWQLGRGESGRTGFQLGSNGPLANRGNFTFAAPSYLVSLQARNNSEFRPASIILSCDDEQRKRVTFSAGQIATIETSWTKPCSIVTIETTDGTSTLFTNMVVQPVDPF
jgi:methionine-rich copper-binding protein CopC/uncharacterized membrane protein